MKDSVIFVSTHIYVQLSDPTNKSADPAFLINRTQFGADEILELMSDVGDYID